MDVDSTIEQPPASSLGFTAASSSTGYSAIQPAPIAPKININEPAKVPIFVP